MQTQGEAATVNPDAVARMPEAVFVERWRLLTGEPPAILLCSRRAMLALLVESAPAAPFVPPVSAWDMGGRNDS
ncbi:hypothetical protein ACFQE0_18495 [Methylobacterium komagatae]|uniref:Uncharacterized protein n=1 Tax=Methylobacterium komagatae TaxID=374425 RepID=A0ABW2BPC4_9HYPH